MRQRKLTPTTILTDAEVAALSAALHESLGPQIVELAAGLGVDTQKMLRFRPVSASCIAAREKLGLTVKEAARRLEAPQYRLKAVEDGRFFELQPEVVRRYISLLGLDAWFRRWRAANRALAAELGLRRSAG